MPPQGLSDRVKQQIFDLRRSGTMTDAEIMADLGVGRGSVLKHGKGARDGQQYRFQRAGHPGRGGTPAPLPPHPRTLPRGQEPRLPDPAPEAGGPSLPDALPLSYTPFSLDGTPGMWGVIGDVHLPYHDKQTIELFVAECRRRDVVGVLLNGDVLDSHELSHHQ